MRVTAILIRLCFALVFVVNVQCAVSFIVDPDSYLTGFQLAGTSGAIAVQGLGIAFLMWNVSYPAFIISPRRFTALGVVILVQQLVGLLGELWLHTRIPAGFDALIASIDRFIVFDGVGLIIMTASFIAYLLLHRRPQA